MIDAFHHHGGVIRRRVLGVKALASILTLGSGGSGGREGPTMQIGAALGSTIGGWLRVGAAERRILMVAGVAAGMSAVFRTPLGAALLAVEVLYRDDFEGEALIPAILASVIAYSVVISIYGESILFARAGRHPFVPAHLPLYGLLALLVAGLASLFVKGLHTTQRLSARLPVPAWVRPAVGGLALGVMTVIIIVSIGPTIHRAGRGLGILGGGYGAAQAAIIGAEWLPSGWTAVELLLSLCAVKLVASCLTIGTGGSAGDFAPSLVLGALFGGAFGRAAQLLLHDPTIDPGAFALVGMGCFYGGVAHVPVSSLILVSELAGSYDLLVPLMLAEGVAFVALRRVSLYGAQFRTRANSPVYRPAADLDRLLAVPTGEVVARDRPFITFAPGTPMSEISAEIGEATWQDTFPVVDSAGTLCGIITADSLRLFAGARDAEAFTVAADLMQPPVTVRTDDSLRSAAEAMLAHGLREIPVVDEAAKVVGFLDEADLSRAYIAASAARSQARQ
jgi:CIC family chloride channel protein